MDTVEDKVVKRRLEWLDHVARMPNHHLLNIIFLDGSLKPIHLVELARDGELKTRYRRTSKY